MDLLPLRFLVGSLVLSGLMLVAVLAVIVVLALVDARPRKEV